jgi:hypothetical protein
VVEGEPVLASLTHAESDAAGEQQNAEEKRKEGRSALDSTDVIGTRRP